MRKRKYSLATPREFVKAWQESSYVREVAKKVGSTKSACSRRATRYRRMGVPLKNMDGMDYYFPTDWDELAEYARELAPEDSDADDEDEDGAETHDQPEGGGCPPAGSLSSPDDTSGGLNDGRSTNVCPKGTT